MVAMERFIGTYIFDPEMTACKMMFLTGPRQVGKTTFAKMWLGGVASADTYFNWDDLLIPLEYRRNPLFFTNTINEKFSGKPVPLVFDEIHKHKEWSNILKGFYDTNRDKVQLLVTGSARLGFFQKSGDSLLGRYFSYQMFPLSLPEAVRHFSHTLDDGEVFTRGSELASLAREAKTEGVEEALELLIKLGGFPEPFLKGSDRFHRRWQKDYKTLITKEEVRDLSRITDIKDLEMLVEILPTKVGSQLSIPSLSEDLGKKYDTIRNWIEILKGVYLVFTLRPWHKLIVRAIKKETKLYFFDWSLMADSGVRFENLLAVSLLRMAVRFTEKGLGEFEVRYIRDREKREVDFVLVKDNKPLALFEAREGGRDISKHGLFFSEKLGIPFYQIVHRAHKVEAFPGDCYIIPAENFLMLTG